MEERCPMCPNQCLKSELKCGRGKRYFNGENHQHHQSFEENHDLTGRLIKASQILEHKKEMKNEREKILDVLYQYENINQQDLLMKLSTDGASLKRFLLRFENEGLIHFQDDFISLTTKGKEIIQNRKTNDEELFDMLNQEEKEELQELLEKVLHSWHKQHMKFQSKK